MKVEISLRYITKYRSLFGLLIAVVVAFAGLYSYAHIGKTIQADDFALGDENFHTAESWAGERFTGSSIEEISSTVERYADSPVASQYPKKYIAWLGNSQLHTINQYKQGDHLAPYWFRKLEPCHDCIVPLGFSLPNANLQEQFVLSEYISNRIVIRALVLELVFDDLREDGLRSEFSPVLSVNLRNKISHYPVGSSILALYDTESGKHSSVQDNHGLNGSVQLSVEESLTNELGEVWPLWKDRQALRSDFLIDLYYLRNWALNIKPTTVRKMIRPRYVRNMQALEAILSECRNNGIPVIMYVAPIRQDYPLPYDSSQYNLWKQSLKKLASDYSATFVNFEKLVPANMWGTYHENDVDFMHFQGAGHKLLAEALLPIVQNIVK